MENATEKGKKPFAYTVRLAFTIIGFIFALLFSIRGIGLLISMLLNGSPSHWFDGSLRLFGILVLIHGAIGSYYILSTGFQMKPMTKGKRLFYLQLLSSAAALIFVIFLIKTSGATAMRVGAFWILNILIAVLGGYHIGKGFFNACITLGIALNQRARSVAGVVAWIIAALAIVQMIALLI